MSFIKIYCLLASENEFNSTENLKSMGCTLKSMGCSRGCTQATKRLGSNVLLYVTMINLGWSGKLNLCTADSNDVQML